MPELEVVGEPDLIISAGYALSVPHFLERIHYYPGARFEEIYHEKEYVHVRTAPVIPIDRQQDATGDALCHPIILDQPEGETVASLKLSLSVFSFVCCRKC